MAGHENKSKAGVDPKHTKDEREHFLIGQNVQIFEESFPPACLPASNWHKLSELFVFLLYIAWKRELPWKFAPFVLFCPITKHSL